MRKLAIFSVLLITLGGFMNPAGAAEECEPVDLLTANKTNVVERLSIGNNQYLICDANVGPKECKYNTIVLYMNNIVYCNDIGGTAIDEWVPADNIIDCPDDLNNYTIIGDYAIQDISKWKNRGNNAYILDSAKWTYHLGNICKIVRQPAPAPKTCLYSGKSYKKGAHITEPCKHMIGKNNVTSAIQECQADGSWSDCKIIECAGKKKPVNGKCPGGVTPPAAKKCMDVGKSFNAGAQAGCPSEAFAAGALSATKICQSDGNWSDCSFVCPKGQSYRKDVGKCLDGATPVPPVNPINPVNPPAPTPVVKIFDCDSTADMFYVREMQVKYANNKTVTDFINGILAFCASDGRNETEFNNRVVQLKILIDRIQGDIKKDQDASTTKIRNALSQISTMRTSYESDASVWKTGDGKFNTSRLVSDSVAGVVLGTAGGLITSSVIKKNQIKGGFEDISCTIGGQVVSDWGDEFTVGIR